MAEARVAHIREANERLGPGNRLRSTSGSRAIRARSLSVLPSVLAVFHVIIFTGLRAQ